MPEDLRSKEAFQRERSHRCRGQSVSFQDVFDECELLKIHHFFQGIFISWLGLKLEF